MTDSLTCREIAAAGLPGLPRTAGGVSRHAMRKGWTHGRLARAGSRAGRPTVEFHVFVLPLLARLAFAEARIGKTIRSGPAGRREWRASILADFRLFHRLAGLPLATAAALYTDQLARIDGPRLSGRTIARWFRDGAGQG